MQPLLTATQMRDADRQAIDGLGIPEAVLMEHAALGVVQALKDRFSTLLPETRGVFLVGPGNNGGDAVAAARILWQNGCSHLFVVLLGQENQLSDETARQLKTLGRLGLARGHELTSDLLGACDWIIDGLFGTGLSRPVEGSPRDAIELVNQYASRKWVVAVDIPSGLSADTGNPLGVAVRASETVTLGFIKKGLVTGQAADYIGKLRLCPIQIPRQVPSIDVQAFLYDASDAARLPERRPASHKGEYGHVYLWAGPAEKQGAAILASRGALRAGAGLVTVVGETTDLSAIRPRLPPEVMTEAWNPTLLTRAPGRWLAIGPGMGIESAQWKRLEKILQSDWNLILDADALTLIGQNATAAKKIMAARTATTLLTPHPKEASRLAGRPVDEIQSDRYRAIRELVDEYHSWVLLKGKGTLVTGPKFPTFVITAGDTGLSKGGTGDTLTGIVAGLLAQQIKPEQAFPLGAFVHGRASEILTQKLGQERSSLASEIADTLPEVFRELARR
jgi:NAD(P)H-hydrate epimerase